MAEKVLFFWLRNWKSALCCDRRSPAGTALFFDFFGGRKFRKFCTFFRLFWDLKNLDFLVSGPTFGLSGQTRQIPKSRDFGDSGQIRMVVPGWPKSRDFRDFAKKSRFCRFLRFWHFLHFFRKFSKISKSRLFPDMSGNVQKLRFWTPQTAQLWGPKISTFGHFLDTSFEIWQVSSDPTCGLWYVLFFWVFCVQKNWKNISLWPQPP